MDEANIIMVRDELANGIYVLTTHQKDEINKLLEEFNDPQIVVAIELDAYKKERRRQEGEMAENDDIEPTKQEYGQTILVSDSNKETEQEGEEQEEAESTLRPEPPQHVET